MSDPLLHGAALWLGALALADLALAVSAGSLLTRLLALDLFSLLGISLLLVLAYQERSTHYLDAALLLALVTFLGTLRTARHIAERRQE